MFNSGFKLILIGVIVSINSHAQAALPGLKCVTGFPTTSFVLSEKEKDVELLVINHNGAKYAPVYSGIVTPSDIEHIKNSGEFFNKIGDYFTIKFAKEDCRIDESKFFTCHINEESEILGHKVNTVYFTTSESIDKIPEFEFVRTNVRLSIRENKGDTLEYKLEMSYYDKDCEIIKEK